MNGKIPVTVIVATLNEEKNLARCLASLERFDEIIVHDSNSKDRTREIALSFGAAYIPFSWNGLYPKKRQWALDNLKLKHDHIFFIDADEEATSELCDEISSLDWRAAGYFIKGLYVVNGKILRHGMSNRKLCLFDRTKMEFPVVDDLDLPGMGEIEGHYQPILKNKLDITTNLRHPVLHYALDNLERYYCRHNDYVAWQHGMKLRRAYPRDPNKARQWAKLIYRQLPFKGLFFFLYYYFGRLGFLEFKNNVAIYKEKRKYHVLK